MECRGKEIEALREWLDKLAYTLVEPMFSEILESSASETLGKVTLPVSLDRKQRRSRINKHEYYAELL